MPDAADEPETAAPELDDENEGPAWDAVEVMRERAAAARHDRDSAINELRESMSDEQMLHDFGINLREIEE